MCLLAVMIVAGCDGCQAADKLDVQARELKREALEPRLQRLAEENPAIAGEVQAVLDGWNFGPERDVYQRVVPLVDDYKTRHPDEADSIERVMRNWRQRIEAFEHARSTG